MQIILASVLRHLLTFAGGWLVGLGVSETDAVNLTGALEPVLTGLVLYGGGQLLSFREKRLR